MEFGILVLISLFAVNTGQARLSVPELLGDDYDDEFCAQIYANPN